MAARVCLPTFPSQPLSPSLSLSRQLSSDITEPKARAAVMQFESARLTFTYRGEDTCCCACFYAEGKKERDIFHLDPSFFRRNGILI